MPKYVYKPTNSLSNRSKRQREKLTAINTLPINYINPSSVSSKPPQLDVLVTESLTCLNHHSYYTTPSVLPNFNVIENVSYKQPEINERNVVSDLNTFESKLATLVVTSRIPRNCVTQLLKLLKSIDSLETIKSLPTDSRTLLSTPQSGNIEIKTIAGGHYIHFGITNGLKHLFNVDPYVHQLMVFELWFNIDGLPIDKKGKSFWPILCGLCVNNSIKPFIIGAYFGAKKPCDVHEYLFPFIEELNDLLNNGLEINDNTLISIQMKGIIADAPARAFIKQCKGHSGYFGCEKCVVEGDYLQGSVCFPDETAEERTNESFLNRHNEEHHVGISPLLQISGIGLVSDIPLDYMHLCCLGIMKKILHCVVRGSKVPNACGPIRLSKDQILLVNKRMKIISKWLCSDFARVPRNLNEYHTFKATELRQIMLYSGPFLFKHIISLPAYNNFIIFNIVMRILSCTKTVYSQNEYAQSLAKHFVKTFGHVFGRGNVSYNVHSFIHLPNDAKKYGVVDNFSSFPYENYLQHIKKILQPGPSPLVQLYNRIIEEQECGNTLVSEVCLHPYLDGHHYEGPLPENIPAESVTQYSTLIMSTSTIRIQKLKRKSTKKDDCAIMSSNSVCIIKNIIKRNSEIYLVCSKFENVRPIYNIPCSSTSVGMFECNKLSSSIELFHINNIKFKACYFPLCDEEPLSTQTNFYVCALLHIIN